MLKSIVGSNLYSAILRHRHLVYHRQHIRLPMIQYQLTLHDHRIHKSVVHQNHLDMNPYHQWWCDCQNCSDRSNVLRVYQHKLHHHWFGMVNINFSSLTKNSKADEGRPSPSHEPWLKLVSMVQRSCVVCSNHQRKYLHQLTLIHSKFVLAMMWHPNHQPNMLYHARLVLVVNMPSEHLGRHSFGKLRWYHHLFEGDRRQSCHHQLHNFREWLFEWLPNEIRRFQKWSYRDHQNVFWLLKFQIF